MSYRIQYCLNMMYFTVEYSSIVIGKEESNPVYTSYIAIYVLVPLFVVAVVAAVVCYYLRHKDSKSVIIVIL